MTRLQKAFEKLSVPCKKLLGRLPQASWQSVVYEMSPRLIRIFPPPNELRQIKLEGDYQLVAFGKSHQFWLPKNTALNEDLWSEYLSVYWNHLVNRHYYFRYYSAFPPGAVVVDCGAFCGFFTRLAVQRGASKVIAIEPNPFMRPCLTATFSEEINQGKVMVENVLLAQTACNLNFEAQPSAAFGGAVSSASTSGVEVKALCLDELIASLALDRLDFLKMDIEGFEIQALLGANKSLQKFHPYLSITTYHRCADHQMLRQYLRTMGYNHIHASGLCRRPNDSPSDWRPVMIYASA